MTPLCRLQQTALKLPPECYTSCSGTCGGPSSGPWQRWAFWGHRTVQQHHREHWKLLGDWRKISQLCLLTDPSQCSARMFLCQEDLVQLMAGKLPWGFEWREYYLLLSIQVLICISQKVVCGVSPWLCFTLKSGVNCCLIESCFILSRMGKKAKCSHQNGKASGSAASFGV